MTFNQNGTRGPEPPDDVAAVIVVTRKRWDRYFLTATAVATVLGIVFSFVLNNRSLLLCPLGVIALWLWLRFQTPSAGMPARRISATPGTPQLLAWLAFMAVLSAGVFALDLLVLGQNWQEPLKLYHLGLFLPLWLGLFLGACMIQKRYSKCNEGTMAMKTEPSNNTQSKTK